MNQTSLDKRIRHRQQCFLITRIDSGKASAVNVDFHSSGLVFVPLQIRGNGPVKILPGYFLREIPGADLPIAEDAAMRTTAVHDKNGNNQRIVIVRFSITGFRHPADSSDENASLFSPGRDPGAGNVHYCALYDRTSKLPFIGSCVGHGGYPYYTQSKDEDYKCPVRVRFLETKSRFWKWPQMRQDVGNNGYCVMSLKHDGSVELKYHDWMKNVRCTARLYKDANDELHIMEIHEM